MSFRQSSWPSDQFSRAPATMVIIGVWVLLYLLSWVGLTILAPLLPFQPSFPFFVTGLVTSAFVVAISAISMLFLCFMMYMFGGSLERSWGTQRFLIFLLLVNVATVISWEIGVVLFTPDHTLISMATPWELVTAALVAWAWLNPEQNILLYFVLPVKAIWIAWVTIVIIYFEMPLSVIQPSLFVPILGLFALGGIGAAILFVKYQRTWGWIPRKTTLSASSRMRHPAANPLDTLLRPYLEWQRRRRIARLQRTIRLDDDRK